jgi:DNA-binding MarR family transcriptional regulator
MASPPSEIRKQREQLLLRMVLRLFQTMNQETIHRMNERGVPEMMPSYPRLLGNLDTDGTRISALSRKMGTSRQATSQLLQEIEDRGFVERSPDPDDKRGVIVRFTPKGRKALGMAVETMLEIEKEYAAILGDGKMAKLKQLLGQLVDEIDPQGGLGLD